MNKKYPLLYNLKKEKKYAFLSWREFYVNILQYISKLFTEQEIPYISHKNFDPRELYKLSKHERSYRYFINFIGKYSLEKGYINIFEKLVDKGFDDKMFICHSIKNKNIRDIRFLLNKYQCDDVKYRNEKIIENAVLEGDIDFLKEILELNIYGNERKNLYNIGMSVAAEKGFTDIVKMMLEKGADDHNATMRSAIKGGFIDIVKIMLEKGADDYNRALLRAVEGEFIDIVKIMLEKGANEYNKGILIAAKLGFNDIVKLLMEKGANNFYDVICYIHGKDSFEIVKNLLEREKNIEDKKINKALSNACKKNNYEIAKYMIENGAKSSSKCLYYSIINNNVDIFNLIIDTCDVNDKYCYFSEYGFPDKKVDKYIYLAAEVGNFEMILKLSEKEDYNTAKIVKYGAKSGNIKVFNFLFYKYENCINLNDILYYAVEGGNINIVKFLIEKGANEFEKSFLRAVEKNDFNIVKLLVYKVQNYKKAISTASTMKTMKTMKYCIF